MIIDTDVLKEDINKYYKKGEVYNSIFFRDISRTC
jgi:hypothetical protein